MSYFKAPAVSEVNPFHIPARTTVIELVTEGVIYFRSDHADLTLGCGALFWHIAGEETICRTDPSAPYECLALAFATPARGERPAPRLSIISDHQRVRELGSELLRAYHDDAIDRAALGAYAYSRLLWEAHLGTGRNSIALHPSAVSTGISFVEAEFRRAEVGVPDIAKAASLSVPHIHTLFREHLGQTPHHFLTTRRIREAKWLLTRTNDTIKAIATDCGFVNIETFYRAFKKIVGTSPHHFRISNSASAMSDIAGLEV
jgi:AraC-like DNA-binding protein